MAPTRRATWSICRSARIRHIVRVLEPHAAARLVWSLTTEIVAGGAWRVPGIHPSPATHHPLSSHVPPPRHESPGQCPTRFDARGDRSLSRPADPQPRGSVLYQITSAIQGDNDLREYYMLGKPVADKVTCKVDQDGHVTEESPDGTVQRYRMDENADAVKIYLTSMPRDSWDEVDNTWFPNPGISISDRILGGRQRGQS